MGRRRNKPDGHAELENIISEATEVAASIPKPKKRDKKRKNLDRLKEGSHLDASVIHEQGGEYDENEPTMAEKLAGLDLLNDDNAKSNIQQDGQQDPSSHANPPRADSVHVLLNQALHADDHALLLECLYTRDEKVIEKSVSLLNPADVLKLLKSLTSMLQSRGAVLVCALPWIRSLLSQHASGIASQESSLHTLNSLNQLICARTSTFDTTSQLSTCLDYLFPGVPDVEADEENIQPFIYEDKDSDEEESEDAIDTDEDSKDLGAVVVSPHDSDGSEIMSD